MTHLQRSRGWPEFRYRLPLDLAGKPAPAWWSSALDDPVNKSRGRFKREIARSDRIHDEAVAERRCADHLRTVDIMVVEARRLIAEGPSRELTPDQRARLANQIHAEILASDERIWRKGLGRRVLAESEVQIPVCLPLRSFGMRSSTVPARVSPSRSRRPLRCARRSVRFTP